MPTIDVRACLPPTGFMARWLEYVRPLESPDSYFLYALLAAAATAVNGRILVNPDSRPACFTNIYTVLYGPSGARKTGAIEEATRLLHLAVPEAPVLPMSFTAEGLISYLAETSAVSGKGAGLIVSHELSDLIGGAEYRAANSKFLTDIWDCHSPYTRRTQAHDYEEIINPYICMVAASAPDWLETTDPRTLAGGFLRRLLLVVEYGPKHRNARPPLDGVLLRALATVMGERLGPGAFGATRMRLDDAAGTWFEGWYMTTVDRIWREAGQKEGHFASCMQAHALKIGAVVNLLEGHGPETLREVPLRTATALVEALLPPMFQAYRSLVPTQYARLRATVLRVLESAGGSLDERLLDKQVGEAAGVPAKVVWLAKEGLVQDGYVTREAGLVRLVAAKGSNGSGP